MKTLSMILLSFILAGQVGAAISDKLNKENSLTKVSSSITVSLYK